MPANKRIGYIDAIRGFTMLLVVFSHVELFTFGIAFNQSAIGSIFITFRMPMFFFISGFIAYKTRTWDFDTYKSLCRKKTLVQIVPTVLFFAFYYYIFVGDTNISFWRKGPMGFWFTIVLFEMFLIYYTVMFLFKSTSSVIKDIILIAISLMGAIAYAGGMKFYDLEIYPIFCLTNLCRYFEFFVLGNLCRKYSDKFIQFISSDKTISWLIVLFIALFSFHWNQYMLYELSWIHIFNYEFLIRFVGVLLVFAIFHRYRLIFENDIRWVQRLKFVGRRTLDIYLIHYFLLPDLKQYGEILLGGGILQ